MKKITLFLLGCFLITACKNDKAPAPTSGGVNCDVAKISTAYVFAAIQANCTSRNCHPGGNSPTVADFSTPDKLKAYINTKRAIFELRVTSAQADMPQSQQLPPLSQGMKDSIACWIAHGLPDQ
ncbi:hypothetical protein CLV51_1011122 [Chitinophaga niastensis]|uniref:Uncharacterized protein n=1 Tax=Chitinophaga niastensis TaxID=536980 RepID=A0A2P8HU91_CHINA|nr:hypothetical protein [Chitinophaga niastensis]PSL49786.1 hypothetical protein CLV51_1011122 [Chitinophaga niastensis]